MAVSPCAPADTLAILPAAGFGSRLRPLTDIVPKELLPLGRRPVFDWILQELEAAGIRKAVGVLSPSKLAIFQRRYGSRFGQVEMDWVVQPEMRGLGDAIRCARNAASDFRSVLVALGDAVFEEPIAGGVTSRVLGTAQPIAIAVQEVAPDKVRRYGIVRPAGDSDKLDPFTIAGVVEKPALDEAPSRFAVCARYKLSTEIFDALDALPSTEGETALTPAVAALIRSGMPACAVPLRDDELRHDIGGFDTYYRAFATYALHDEEHGAELRTFLGDALT